MDLRRSRRRPSSPLTLVALGLAVAGGLSACAAGGARRGAEAAAEVRPSLAVAAARLPAEVAGFTRGTATEHEGDRPGMGIAVDYTAPNRAAVATASIYDRGQPLVPDDPSSPAVSAEFEAAVQEVLEMAARRTNHRMVERERMMLPVPGAAVAATVATPATAAVAAAAGETVAQQRQQPVRCAQLEGVYGGQAVATLVCVGGAAGRFVKVMVTAPARQVHPVDPIPFVQGIAAAARSGEGGAEVAAAAGGN